MSKKWTIMVYLAGDNNLEGFGHRDLMEMKAVGSNDAINIVTQFDQMSDDITRRFYLTHDRPLAADIVAELPETNTGDPATLLDFILWGLSEYPAEQTALILWNHGTGWKDDNIYELARRANLDNSDIPRSLVPNAHQQRIGRSLFATSIQTIVQYPPSIRGILFDDTSSDFLDNQELKHILDDILSGRHDQKIDLIGFDACLMNMVEVAAQIQHACHHMVGSQEIEPGDGWPYNRILTQLAARPNLSAEALGRIIVETYTDHYNENPSAFAVTQSAIRLEKIPALVEAIGQLADSLVDQLSDPIFFGEVLMPTMRRVQKFRDRQYVDLGHFGQLIVDRTEEGPVRQLAEEVVAWLDPTETNSIVTARTGFTPNGDATRDNNLKARQNTIINNGLSIYMPFYGKISPAYADLEFSQRCSWNKFLEAFLES